MKKFLSYLCAAAMLVSLTACSKSTGSAPHAGESVTGQVTAISDSTVTLQLGELKQAENDNDTNGTPPALPGSTDNASTDGTGSGNTQGSTPPEKPEGDSMGGGQTPPDADGSSNNGTPPDADSSSNGGSTPARQLTTLPATPATRYPAKAARFMAMAPGADWPTAAIPSRSSSVKHCRRVTKYFRIMGTTTYPPPKAKALMSRLTPNSHRQSRAFFMEAVPPFSRPSQYTACKPICKMIDFQCSHEFFSCLEGIS